MEVNDQRCQLGKSIDIVTYGTCFDRQNVDRSAYFYVWIALKNKLNLFDDPKHFPERQILNEKGDKKRKA